ncbi:phytanoyl-CoA dioxygenase family protein [bacterium]|nr:phytanoyl-CoA dioxygenase family protein [bacterium]
MIAEAAYFTRQPDWASGLARIASTGFWRSLNPQLHLTDTPFSGPAQPYSVEPAQVSQALEQVCQEGYLQTAPAIPTQLCEALAQGVLNIIAAGLHPIYVSLYDEYWQILRNLAPIFGPVLGDGYLPLGDFWCWCISQETSGSGWGAHRDYQFKSNATRQDGRPLLVTAWLPFTDTDPLNGCMYLVPQDRDEFIPDRLDQLGFKNPQDLRALPARAGSVLAWNQYVQHWGGRYSRWAKGPRIATGVYLQSGDVEPFVGKVVHFDQPLLPATRLGFIASNILNYHMYHHYPEPVLRMCFDHVQLLPNFVELVPPALRNPMADYLDELETAGG